jgi:hypothetical protein
MRHGTTTIALLALIVAFTGDFWGPRGEAAQGPRRDGRWEVTTQMEMGGMPAPMPATTITQCITKEQASDPQRFVPRGPQRGSEQNDCKVENFKTDGNKVTWSMRCTTPQPMTGTGELTYGADSYVGTQTMNMERGGQAMTMTMKYTGKRLGDCTQ